jgi:hypothetical protein
MVNGEDLADLAREAEIPLSTFGRRLREHGQARPERRPVRATGRFEDHWKLLAKLIGRDPKRPLPKPVKRKQAKDRRKVAVVCDMHGYPLPALVAEVLHREPDIIAFDGDVFDAFAFSHWEKDHHSPIADEIARVRAVLEQCQVHGIEVKMNSGNHDDRAKKYFARRVDAEFMPLVQYNLLELAALNLPLVEVVTNTYSFTTATGAIHRGAFTNNWLIHLGDALIGHAETARKGEIRSVDAFAEWVEQWREPLGWGPVRLLIQAHVHRAGISYPSGGNKVRVEGGFAGDLRGLQYVMDYGSTAYPPPVVGFSTFTQNLVAGSWVTDLATVRFNLC